ncbi:MAG: RluA family pseudouridine synthase, partial [Treponema sp.]|nr:RluA family pseudouridine synthase [Treponema sp.]
TGQNSPQESQVVRSTAEILESQCKSNRLLQLAHWTSHSQERLDVFLRRELAGLMPAGVVLSNSKLRRMIVAGCVTVDGRECRRPAFELRKGCRVSVSLDADRLFYEKDNGDIEFVLEAKDVLFEDDVIIVVNKPPFLPSEETVVKERRNLHQAVIDYLWKNNPSLRNPPYVGIMHRLDRETSGAILFTKSRSVNKAVHDAFEGHKVRKVYRAVSGCRDERGLSALCLPYSFSVEGFVGRVSPRGSPCKMGNLSEAEGGLYAHTDFSLLSLERRVGKTLCYFDCCLQTGRTHQIRLHLSNSGFPIIGDSLYGGEAGFEENGGRIMLHARLLEFCHPLSGNLISCEACLPPLFAPASPEMGCIPEKGI